MQFNVPLFTLRVPFIETLPPISNEFPLRFNVESISKFPDIFMLLLSAYPSLILTSPEYVSLTFAVPVKFIYPETSQSVPVNSPITTTWLLFSLFKVIKLSSSNIRFEKCELPLDDEEKLIA